VAALVILALLAAAYYLLNSRRSSCSLPMWSGSARPTPHDSVVFVSLRCSSRCSTAPGHPLPTWPAPTPPRQAARGQGRRRRPPARLLPPTWDRPAHRPARHRIEQAPGLAQMEDRALDLPGFRLPAPGHPLRTQSPLLRRVPLASRHHHLLQIARKTHHVSHGLHAGVPATQVAECAAHSVDVLLRICAKCLDGT